MLWMFQRVYYGAVTNGENRDLPDLRPHEWSSVVPAVRRGARDGRVPVRLSAPMEPAVTRVVERMQNTRTLRVQVRETVHAPTSDASDTTTVTPRTKTTPVWCHRGNEW